MKVVYFQRKPSSSYYSIERVFNDIRSSLDENIRWKVYVCRFYSKGIIRRFVDCCVAAFHQGDVNHITGDVHFLSFFLSKKRTILTIHDCVSLGRSSGIKYWIYWFFWYWLPIKRSSVVTVISESTKNELLFHMRDQNLQVEVVHDCVSSQFVFMPHQFNQKEPRILHIGTKQNKNLERVIEALNDVTCLLVIVGSLTKEQSFLLSKYCVKFLNLKNLTFEEMITQYNLCDIVMFPSLYEGFGLPILEGQAVGRPVITSNILSMPEVGGDGVCYVNPHDANEIKNAVLKILNNESFCNEIVKLGLLNVQNFSSAHISKRYSQIYNKIFDKF
jgi:glycosyltransferase involved in cell wall biosynthesis